MDGPSMLHNIIAGPQRYAQQCYAQYYGLGYITSRYNHVGLTDFNGRENVMGS